MATKAQKIRLAVFFIAVNSVLAAFVIFTTGSHLLAKRDIYRIEFSGVSVGGLNNGAQVKYQGITVGRVEGSHISPEDIGVVVVEISIDPDKAGNAIRTNTQAVISSLGLTGLKYIELIPGTSQAPVLPPGSRITAGQTFLSDIDRQAEILSGKIELLLDRINQLLDEKNQQDFASTLAAASALTAGAADILQENRRHVDTTLENMALASRSLTRSTVILQASMDSLHQFLASDQTRTTLDDIQATARYVRQTVEGPLPELIASMTQMTDDIDKTFIHVDQTILQSRSSLVNAMADLEETMQNIQELSEIVRDNPSILIRGGSRTDEQN